MLIGQYIKAGAPQLAFYGFAVFYALCLVLNWWFYLRGNAYVKNPEPVGPGAALSLDRHVRRDHPHWNPKTRFLGAPGEASPARNLWMSIPALALSFAVWMLGRWWWFICRSRLPIQHQPAVLADGAAGPVRRHAAHLLRLRRAGDRRRRFTTLATASLLLPAIGIGLAVQDPSTPFEWMVVLALLCGLGAATSPARWRNISYFFPPHARLCALA